MSGRIAVSDNSQLACHLRIEIGPFKALWSHSEHVTLSGGLGGAIANGWTQVSERLDWVATQYTGGVRTHQEVARYVGQDLAYVVLRETPTVTRHVA